VSVLADRSFVFIHAIEGHHPKCDGMWKARRELGWDPGFRLPATIASTDLREGTWVECGNFQQRPCRNGEHKKFSGRHPLTDLSWHNEWGKC
jgi:hypothetical protein